MVPLSLRGLSVLVAVLEVLSFVCLVVAISTDYWYIIDTSGWEDNVSLAPSSHSGLWRVCYAAEKECVSLINPFRSTQNYTASLKRLIHLQRAFSVLLPLGGVLMVLGGVLGVHGLVARAHLLLTLTGTLLLLAAVVSMTGAAVYMSYSSVALRELTCSLEPRALQGLDLRFGWSLALAWGAGGAQLLASGPVLLARRVVLRQREEHSL